MFYVMFYVESVVKGGFIKETFAVTSAIERKVERFHLFVRLQQSQRMAKKKAARIPSIEFSRLRDPFARTVNPPLPPIWMVSYFSVVFQISYIRVATMPGHCL